MTIIDDLKKLDHVKIYEDCITHESKIAFNRDIVLIVWHGSQRNGKVFYKFNHDDFISDIPSYFNMMVETMLKSEHYRPLSYTLAECDNEGWYPSLNKSDYNNINKVVYY